MKKFIIGLILLIIILIIAGFIFGVFSSGDENAKNTQKAVKVTRRNIIDKALAVGTIDPKNEISVKSKISGIVKKVFIEAGTYVKCGDLLLEIQPDPTPLELAEAKRNLEMTQIELNSVTRELKRKEQLKNKGLISDTEFETQQSQYNQAVLREKIAREKLSLIEKGKVKIANTNIESVIKAPTDGFILEKFIDVGDPVVPLTSYQEGTVLMTMANMDNLIFKGTVDEIDVGKLVEGMPVEIKIGALPGKIIEGNLTKISLKAKKDENATVFPIEIAIGKTGGLVLRAGYSANADIIIQKKDSVLTLPERVIDFRNDSSFVRVKDENDLPKEISIETGLSDAIYIEIVSGVKEDQEVLEKKLKEIE